MIVEPSIVIRLDGNGRAYKPGEQLGGEYRFDAVARGEVRAVEISVLWYTEGKGDEDLSVHDFRRLAAEESGAADPAAPGRFQTVLPNSPLSYEGQIVKVRWCVRVRAFLGRGREIVGQQQFRLGEVPPSKCVVGDEAGQSAATKISNR